MKKYIITSLLLLVPFISMAADHCTNPSEYTVDKRCYVTDEQKKEKPYNAVVGIMYNIGYYGSISCTGTIAKLTRKDSSDSNLYLFTAKHCTDQDGDGISDRILHIKLQNGDKLKVTLVETGNYNTKEDSNLYGDWAVYSLPIDAQKQMPWIYADSNSYRDGRAIKLIGYGALKIMSDKEISELKQKYINALKKNGITDMSYENTGLADDRGMFLVRADLIKISAREYKNLFMNDQLKVSRCFFRRANNLCQGWSGNSGGPMVDDSNRLVSILTRGESVIGGYDHAMIGGYMYETASGEEPGYKDADIPVGRIYEKIGKLPSKESLEKHTDEERVHEKISEFLYKK